VVANVNNLEDAQNVEEMREKNDLLPSWQLLR